MFGFYLARFTENESRLRRYSLDRVVLQADLKGRHVSLVGNAHALEHETYGPEIDSASIVIRINNAPIPDPASHGTRTDWMAVGIPLTKSLLAYRHPQRVLWMADRPKRLQLWLAQDRRFYLNRRSDWQDLHQLLGAPPTTGLMMIRFLEQSEAASITIFGFEFRERRLRRRRGSGKHTPHDFAAEKRYIDELIGRNPNIKLRAMTAS